MSKQNIVWLASYPKSGNTWFRAFITAVLNDDRKVDINKLWINFHFSSRLVFENVTELNSYELNMDEIDNLRPEVYRYIAQQNPEKVYIKIHNHFQCAPSGVPIIPIEHTHTVVYVIRNPLDVLVSFAYHNGWSIEKMKQLMCKNYVLARPHNESTKPPTLHEYLADWSTHVESWVDNDKLNVIVIRYEDMLNTPESTFSKALNALEIDFDKKLLNEALDATSFKNLHKQEKEHIFKEKNPRSAAFFRKGQVGDWRNHLSYSEIENFVHFHKKVMLRFGYLDNNLNPIY